MTASAKNGGKRRDRPNGMRLDEYVHTFPTPTATAYKGWSTNHNRADTNDRLDYTIEREAAGNRTQGRLNPDWCEWLMGWEVGWTDLECETPWFFGWESDPSEKFNVPRVTTKGKNRAHRIRCIGNGQVPQAMKLAYEILSEG